MRVFQLPDTLDSQGRRYRQILNVFLWILLGTVIVFGLIQFIPPVNLEDGFLYSVVFSFAFGAMLIVLLWLNSRTSIPVNIISLVFLALLTLGIGLSDAPEHMVDGRSSMVWAIPIIISAAILPWWGVYATAGMGGLLFSILTYTIPDRLYPNPFALFNLLILAFLAWVIAAIQTRSIRDAGREAANRQAVLEGMSDGVVVYDANRDILSLNQAGSSMADNETLAGIVVGEQSTYSAPDGRVFSISRSPVEGVGTVAVFRDETRRVEVARAKDSMLATVSHELRTPLASISGYSEMMRDMLVDDPQMSKMAGRIFSNASRLRALVSDLLDRAQIEAGNIRIRPNPYNIRDVLAEVDAVMRGLAEDKNIDLNFVCDDSVPSEIVGDSGRVHQILINLVGNAVKFTDGGLVTVRAVCVDDTLLLDVSDTGCGIAPAHLPDIFQPFRRGSDYATRRHQGVGLGLSISKQLVELMGGSISVQSSVGHGTVFQVSLPLFIAESKTEESTK
jgi:signal transduction histidine kinase